MRSLAHLAAMGVAAGLSALLVACAPQEGKKPPPLDPEMVALGRKVYVEHCAACHGPSGEGQPDWETPNALGELPAPPHDSTGHTWKHSDAMLYQITLHGWRDPFNETERLTMPAFRAVLSPREVRAVITYLKTLWTEEQRKFQLDESREEPFPATSSS